MRRTKKTGFRFVSKIIQFGYAVAERNGKWYATTSPEIRKFMRRWKNGTTCVRH